MTPPATKLFLVLCNKIRKEAVYLSTQTHKLMKPNIKTSLKTTGYVEIDRATLSQILIPWIKDNLGYTATKLQYSSDGNKIVAVIESVVDGGAKPIGIVKEPRKTTKYEGANHKWEGLYGAVGEILDEQRKRKKTFISYDDLLAEMHEMEDNRGNKLFVKGGEELPMSVLRHRLAPSQLVRQSKGQPNLKGVENKKKDRGLKFS